MQRMIFFNGGWMPSYNGIENEKIVRGGSYIDKHRFGGEAYNFRNSNGEYYGYVTTTSNKINLNRINFGQKYNGDFIDNVICVFVATASQGGRRIVGWYRNAKIYSQYQFYTGNDRKIMLRQEDWLSNSNQVGYYALAQKSDVVLLPEVERLDGPEVPTGKDGFGQYNIWYADSVIGIEFKKKVYKFISAYEKNESEKMAIERKRNNQSKVDSAMKKRVEETAIKRTMSYYEDLGYVCKSVESENLGWDLEVSRGKVKLLVEVKGLSQSLVSVMLSRNEYEKMLDNLNDYRLSVVTNCLDKNQTINIFSYLTDKGGWFDKYGNELDIKEIVAARCEIK